MDLIDDATAPPQEELAIAALAQHDYSFVFTGSGSEYFRIWIVNIAITVATLGIYSAWAKVRQVQYFYRNTLLDGIPFNYHAEPIVILRGRVVAVVLALAYHYAFGFSMELGIAVVAFLVFGLPYLLMSALRFRLRSSSYRGLRFGFAGRTRAAYASYAPLVAIFLVPGAVASIPAVEDYVSASMLLYLGWPFAYSWMKRYQHGNLRYAQCESTYTVETSDFFVIYWKMMGIIVLGVLVALLMAVIAGVVSTSIGDDNKRAEALGIAFVIFGSIYLMYLITVPFVTSRVANLVWNDTCLAGVSFESLIKARALIALQMRNTILTLITLGLFRPFAIVSVHRYRISCFTVRSATPLATVLAGAHASAPGAAGDGAADMLGFDLSW